MTNGIPPPKLIVLYRDSNKSFKPLYMPLKVTTFYEPNPPTGFIAGFNAEALSEIPFRHIHTQFSCRFSRLELLESIRITSFYKLSDFVLFFFKVC